MRTVRRRVPTTKRALASMLASASLAALAVTGCGSSHRASTPTTGAAATTGPGTTLPTVRVASGWTLLVDLSQAVQGYTSPGGPTSVTVPARVFGQAVRLPVIAQQPGWFDVRVPQKPNGTTAWIKVQPGIAFSSTPDRIVVDLKARELTLYNQGKVVLTAPAGIGMPKYPTPAGNFFVLFFEQPLNRNPGYGPFVMVTSGHSTTISDWMESGDAVVAIHGPLGAEIPAGGAAVSHGCVRLNLDAQKGLTDVPPGTPVDIVASGGG